MPQKTRAQTIQQRFGFKDDDLRSSKHDEIMVWLDGAIECIFQQPRTFKRFVHAHVGSYSPVQVESLGEAKHHWQRPKDDDLQAFARMTGEDIRARAGPPPKHPGVEIDKIWESPITTGKDNRFIVGFIDMECTVDYPRLLAVAHGTCEKKPDPYREGKTCDTYAGFEIEWRIDSYGATRTHLFEVKADIPSLGELIRQLRMYEEYKRGTYWVVSPDTRWREQIIAQGFRFLDPNESVEVMEDTP